MIKRFLRRWPRLYHKAQRFYYDTLYWIERNVLGSRMHEFMWRYRQFEDFRARPTVHPHRPFLVQRLRARAPFTSILEVGCSAGANLTLFANAFPDVRLYGVDVNTRAVAEVQRLIDAGELRGVTVSAGNANDLRAFVDASVDIVLADATLMYVGPDKIDRALGEMVRVARQAVIVNDWHLFDPASRTEFSRWYDAHWVHDYRRLFATHQRVGTVHVERLPPGLWGGSGWSEYGALIQVEMEPTGAKGR